MPNNFQGWKDYRNKAPKKGRVIDFNGEQRQSKYGNKKTDVGDIRFDSKKEATRYKHLKILEDSGYIKDLRLQVPYSITVNGVKICDYIADFVYYDSGMQVVEDAKGFRTRDYRLKKKLMKAVHDIEIKEV